jgi:ribosome-associated toxin RatA of RatAB toxin-antitoxin module
VLEDLPLQNGSGSSLAGPRAGFILCSHSFAAAVAAGAAADGDLGDRYTSKVKLQPPNLVSSTVADSALFHHLESIWKMTPGPTPNTTWLSFSVDFAFLNPLYANVAHLFFSEVVIRMMSAFEGRCKYLYGPPSFAAAKQGRQQLPHGQLHQQQHIAQQYSMQRQQEQQQLAQHEAVEAMAAATGKHGVVADVMPEHVDRTK